MAMFGNGRVTPNSFMESLDFSQPKDGANGLLQAFSPSLTQRAAYGLGDLLSGVGVDDRLSYRTGRQAASLADAFTPLGNASAVQEQYRAGRDAADRGDTFGRLMAAGGMALAALPLPGAGRTLERRALPAIHANAEEFARLLRSKGEPVGSVSHSMNRNGDYSSYVHTRFGEVRLSDHDTISPVDYKWFGDVTPDRVDDFIASGNAYLERSRAANEARAVANQNAATARKAAYDGQMARQAANRQKDADFNDWLRGRGIDPSMTTQTMRNKMRGDYEIGIAVAKVLGRAP